MVRYRRPQEKHSNGRTAAEREKKMKIKINKKTIVLEDVQRAREMAASEGSWIDATIIKYCAGEILRKYYGRDEYVNEVIKLPDLEITMNHYEMTVYATDAYVEYWHDGTKIAVMSFDVLRTYNGEPEAFLRVLGETFSGVI